MDINKITLKYLTNYSRKSNNADQKEEPYKTDLDFYKRRIYKLTKDLLLGTSINSDIDSYFKSFANQCIEYFKFIDKRDIIQDDYKNLVVSKEDNEVSELNMTTINNTLKKNKRSLDISDLLNIKPIKIPKKIILPQERTFCLKKQNLKTKGCCKKNINNKYEKKIEKKKAAQKKKNP